MDSRPNVAVHEFKGTCPTIEMPHGNASTGRAGPYVRLDPDVMTSVMTDISNKKKPNQIYKENVGAKEVGGLRNKNQIYMAAKRSKKRIKRSDAKFKFCRSSQIN